MNMVEQVARAMVAAHVKAGNGDETAIECMAKHGQEYMRDARAAIEAMRHATPEMVEASRREAAMAAGRLQHGAAIWRDAHFAMIDAALIEPRS